MKVKCNGTWRFPESGTLFGLRDMLGYSSRDVTIINGYDTASDVPLHDKDEVFFIRRGELPSEEVLEQMMAARHTPRVHERVKNSCVAVAGLGGLGSNIAVMLARTGVGHLKLIDFDCVEPSNLNRQNYDMRHLGKAKCEALKAQIKDINPFIQVEAVAERIIPDNIGRLFKECDVVCEALDRAETKAMLINGIMEHFPGKPVVSGSGMAGYDSSNTIKTQRVMGSLYICGDGISEAEAGRGLMAPRVMVCAGHQANMALRLLLGMTLC